MHWRKNPYLPFPKEGIAQAVTLLICVFLFLPREEVRLAVLWREGFLRHTAAFGMCPDEKHSMPNSGQNGGSKKIKSIVCRWYATPLQ